MHPPAHGGVSRWHGNDLSEGRGFPLSAGIGGSALNRGSRIRSIVRRKPVAYSLGYLLQIGWHLHTTARRKPVPEVTRSPHPILLNKPATLPVAGFFDSTGVDHFRSEVLPAIACTAASELSCVFCFSFSDPGYSPISGRSPERAPWGESMPERWPECASFDDRPDPLPDEESMPERWPDICSAAPSRAPCSASEWLPVGCCDAHCLPECPAACCWEKAALTSCSFSFRSACEGAFPSLTSSSTLFWKSRSQGSQVVFLFSFITSLLGCLPSCMQIMRRGEEVQPVSEKKPYHPKPTPKTSPSEIPTHRSSWS